MTEKLYYKDAYIKDFTATVLSASEVDGRFEVILDRTAFFPEEGGQSADNGTIAGVRVLDVTEREGVVYHFLESAPALGVVECHIDFDERFQKMQCHTAEHILSGYIHKLFGFDNIGFHLGDVEVTMDINGVLTRAQLDEIEYLANMAVFANVEVTTSFPSKDELSALKYRSKLDLVDDVRIVNIGEYDSCACCAPHVARTGEIGLIKILDFEKHRGGLRLYITAGVRALYDYRNKYTNVQRVSALFSEPQNEIGAAAERFLESLANTKAKLKEKCLESAVLKAQMIEPTEKNMVLLYPDMSMDEMREFSNVAMKKVAGLLVVLSGNDGEYRYIISYDGRELSGLAKEFNSSLSGRGGGRGSMIQGTFYTSLESIRAYFE